MLGVEAPDRAVTNLFLMAGAATLFRLNLNSFLKKQQFHFLKSSRVGNVHQGKIFGVLVYCLCADFLVIIYYNENQKDMTNLKAYETTRKSRKKHKGEP